MNIYIEILKEFVDVIKAVAWPITTIIVIYTFKQEIGGLIDEIKIKISYGKTEVEITKKKAQEQQLEATQSNKDELNKLIENLKDDQAKEKKLLLALQENTAKDRDTFLIGYHFEKTYRLIFGSQLAILIQMHSHTTISDALVSAIYRRTQWATVYPYESFVGFLISSGLITQLNSSDSTYSITPLGKSFIAYLKTNNILPAAKQPF